MDAVRPKHRSPLAHVSVRALDGISPVVPRTCQVHEGFGREGWRRLEGQRGGDDGVARGRLGGDGAGTGSFLFFLTQLVSDRKMEA
jgi:hypothetical protein